ITQKPAANTSKAVPKSGWWAIRANGTANSTAATKKSIRRSRDWFLWKYHANISGTANFIISDGWIRVNPRSSQRVAPLLVSPKNSTPSSKTTPSPYTHGASRLSSGTGTSAATHITTNANAKLRIWAAKRQSVPPTAECITVRPNMANNVNKANRGQSKAVTARIVS